MTRTRAAVGAAAIMVALVAGACGGDGDDGAGATASAPATSAAAGAGDGATGTEQTVTIRDFTYDPASLTIEGATTIEVVNEDDAAHTFTLDDDSVDEEIEGGASATVKIDPAESIGWHCEIHPDMTGSITVG